MPVCAASLSLSLFYIYIYIYIYTYIPGMLVIFDDSSGESIVRIGSLSTNGWGARAFLKAEPICALGRFVRLCGGCSCRRVWCVVFVQHLRGWFHTCGSTPSI
jgi:hypothetical protein